MALAVCTNQSLLFLTFLCLCWAASILFARLTLLRTALRYEESTGKLGSSLSRRREGRGVSEGSAEGVNSPGLVPRLHLFAAKPGNKVMNNRRLVFERFTLPPPCPTDPCCPFPHFSSVCVHAGTCTTHTHVMCLLFIVHVHVCASQHSMQL